ncbi:MAG TPA: rhomboid family intramembrane serine protease [Opitutaceae bacterium]
MSGYRDWSPSSEEHRPLTYWGGYAIYAIDAVIITYVVLMIVTAIGGFHLNPMLRWLFFTSDYVYSGQVWRIFTYGLFNEPSVNPFAWNMLMLFWSGRELERFFGRKILSALYGGIYLIAPLSLTLLGLLKPTGLSGQPGALAVFVAFATQFPTMPVLFVLLAKYAAMILVGIFTMIHLANRDWDSLTVLLATCTFAHLFVRYQQGHFTLPSFKLFRRKPKLRVLPDLPPRSGGTRPASVPQAAANPAPDATMAEVDALLDKIAKSGINSLTARERAKLEAAREGLLRRGGK